MIITIINVFVSILGMSSETDDVNNDPIQGLLNDTGEYILLITLCKINLIIYLKLSSTFYE